MGPEEGASQPSRKVSFAQLSPAEQQAVREAQKKAKLAKAQAKDSRRRAADADTGQQQKVPPKPDTCRKGAACDAIAGEDLLLGVASGDYPTRISLETYIAACPGGCFRDPSLPPTERSLALLM